MATVNGHVSVQVQDYNPTIRAVQEYFSCTSGLLSDMTAFAQAFASAYDLVTGGKILKLTLNIPITLPGGLKGAAVAGINNSLAGLFDWTSASTTDKFGVAYPAWYTANAGNGFLPANPKLVNQADAAVAAFIAFQEAITSLTVVTTEDGTQLTGVARAIKSTRSTRKQLART